MFSMTLALAASTKSRIADNSTYKRMIQTTRNPAVPLSQMRTRVLIPGIPSLFRAHHHLGGLLDIRTLKPAVQDQVII